VRADEIGGALVDAARNVVGMVAATPTVATTTARPWSAVMTIVDTIDRGRTTSAVHVGQRASLGVVVTALTGSPGAQVARVDARAPAAAAIHSGEVIARVAGVSVSADGDIERALDPYAPGDAVPVDVFDGHGVLRTVSVRLTAA
jgi:S1-C subfamily serine protease